MSDIQKFTKGEMVSFRPQDIVEARYKLTSKQNDILDIIISKMRNDEQLRYSIDINEYKPYYLEQKHIYKDFKKNVETASAKGLGIRGKDQNDYTYYPWFSKIRYIDKEGRIEVDFHPEMKAILLNCINKKELKKIFYNLKYSIKLTNEYAKRYYYYCKSFEDTKWRKDKMEDLMIKMECPKSYYKKSNFKKNVLNVANKQINEYTDLDIDIDIDEMGFVKTSINKKTPEQLKELDELLSNKRNKKEVKVSGGNTRIQIEELTKTYKTINAEAKREISDKLGISVKSVERYIVINEYLIPDLKELLDKKFLGVLEVYNIAKPKEKYTSEENIEYQKKQLASIKRKCNKFKKTLCVEMQRLLDDKKISFKVAERNSLKTEAEQLRYLKNNYKNLDNELAIDVNFKEIDTEQKEEIREDVSMVIELLSRYSVTEKQAEKILENANGDIERIKYIYGELENQETIINKPIGWITSMVKEGAYQPQKVAYIPKTKGFNNFEPRKYDYNRLEKQLLGWDEVSEQESDTSENDELEEDINTNDIKSVLEEDIRPIVGEVPFTCWFKKGILDIEKEGAELKIICVNEITKKILIDRYSPYIEEIVKAKYPDVLSIKYKL